MKTNQNDQLKNDKSSDKGNSKPLMTEEQKRNKANVQFTKTDSADKKDANGKHVKEEEEEAETAGKIHGHTEVSKTREKTGKNNLKKSGL